MVVLKMCLIILCHLCHLSWQSQLFKSKIKLNPVTRGYEDITVVIDNSLESDNCVQILDSIKVNNINHYT